MTDIYEMFGKVGVGKGKRFVPSYHLGLISKADGNSALYAGGCLS